MARLRLAILGSALILTSLGCAGASPEGDDRNPGAALPAEVEIPMSAAQLQASATLEAGILVEGELELGEDEASYEFEYLVDGVARELVVSASTGEVLANEIDEEDQAEAEASAARLAELDVDLARAIELAEGQTGGQVLEAEFGDEGFELIVLSKAGTERIVSSFEDASILSREPVELGPDEDEDEGEDDAADDAGEEDDTDDVN